MSGQETAEERVNGITAAEFERAVIKIIGPLGNWPAGVSLTINDLWAMKFTVAEAAEDIRLTRAGEVR